MRKFALAWLLMWALSYFAVATLAPGVGGTSERVGAALYTLVGGLILIALTLTVTQSPMLRGTGKLMLLVLGLFEVWGGVASWTGVSIWNIPFANKELFQVSMAFADLISAAFMLYLVLRD